jgi:hypothetical protein
MNYKGLKLLSNELNMLWLNEQSEIKKDTDIVMSNIINKNVLSRCDHRFICSISLSK